MVTNGAGHLASLRLVVEQAASSFERGWAWVDPMSDAFSLENGGEQFRSLRRGPLRPWRTR